MIEYYLAGGLLRGMQVLIDASVWIAFGCCIAAIFRNMLGAENTRSLFGDNSRYGLFVGWGIGMLLPVCSLGVIPVLQELRRSGVKSKTIIAFGLTAPLFNPLSILYGLSMSDPIAVIIFSAAAMMIVTALGTMWGKWFDAGPSLGRASEEAEEISTSGIRRSLAVLHTAATEMIGLSSVFIVIGILASTLTSVAFSHGSLSASVEPDKLFAPAFMATYVTPIYSTPLLTMSQIGSMFQHGNSVGAAFSLLILGAGVNLGLLCWFAIALGFRRVMIFVALLMSLTIGLAYAMDKPLYPAGVTPAGHTHAFDIYTHPYHDTQTGLLSTAAEEVGEYMQEKGTYGLKFLGGLVVLGIVFRMVELRWDLSSWFKSREETPSDWDIALPPWIIGLVACAGLVALSVVGTFIYYPPPESLLDDLSAINANCVVAANSSDWEGVEKWVPFCDDLSRRLEVGVFLREGSVSEFKRAKAKVYREKLDELRDNIAAGQTVGIKDQAMDLLQSYSQLSKAFRNQE